MDLKLKGRVALVSGSSRGIGYAAARALLAEDARVVVTGRDRDALDRAAETLRIETGGAVLPIAGDLTSESHIVHTLEQIARQWEAPDCIVANIGSGRARTGWDISDAEWTRAFEANFGSSQRLVRAALSPMIERKRGSIVFVASIAGLEALPAPFPYSAAKAALIAYSKALACQVAAFGIRVNSVAPGNVLFPGGSWERHLAERHDAVVDYINADVPMRRFGTPAEIADVIVFLCSDRASFMTGACVAVDGGQTRAFA